MSGSRSYIAILVLLTLLAGLSGILGNIAASVLPEAWQPHLWLAWPLFFVLMLVTVGLVMWQARLEQQVAPTAPASQMPHNLPSRSEFIGRGNEKERIHEALRSRSCLISVDGIGGIGKTALALEAAHECLRASKGETPPDGVATFDGFIWTTAKDRDLTLNGLLDAVARTLEYPGIAQQPTEEKRIAVRKLLQEKPYLLIVDNFETITDNGVRDFLRGLPEPSKALITTREQKVQQAWAISLKGLNESEGLALIRSEGKRLGLTSVEQADDQRLLYLCQATGGAPLAIKWAVGQIKQRGLDAVLAALHEGRGNVFDGIFTRSWDLLSASAQQVLTVMPLFATSASREGIEAVSNVSTLDEALGQLVEMSLVDATDELDLTQRRYSIHPLTHAFATAHLQQQPEVQDAAKRRLTQFYLDFCSTVREEDYPAFSRMDKESKNVLALMDWCEQTGRTQELVALTISVERYLWARGYWSEWQRYLTQALRFAQADNDSKSEAMVQRALGALYLYRDELDTARFHFEQALAIRRTIMQHRQAPGTDGVGGASGLAIPPITKEEAQEYSWVISGLIGIYSHCSELPKAKELLREAIEIVREADDKRSIARLQRSEALIAWKEGSYAEAKRLLESSRRYREDRKESSAGLARNYEILGKIAVDEEDFVGAKEYFSYALRTAENAGVKHLVAYSKWNLARLARRQGQLMEACELASQAQEMFNRLGMQKHLEKVVGWLKELGQLRIPREECDS